MPRRNRQRKGTTKRMEDQTKVKLITVVPDSAANDLEQPPEDLPEVMAKMRTQETALRNAVKMIQGLIKDGFLDMGLVIGSRIEETTEVPQVVTYTAVIEYYVNAAGDRTRDALRVFKHMLVSGVAPNAYTYAIIIKALAATHTKNPDFNYISYAKGYFVEMLGKGMQPNEETFSALLEGIGSSEEERRVFVKLVKEKGFLQLKEDETAREVARGSQLNTEMNKLKEHVMKVFEDTIKVCGDEDTQGKFKEIGEDYESLSQWAFSIFNALIRRGLQEEAKELLKPLLETGIMPDEAVFIIVIFVSGTFGKNKGAALKAYKHMLSYGITPSACTYNLLIVLLATDPNFIGDAKKYLLEMSDKGMKPFLETSLAVFNGVACLESLEKGKELFEQIKPKAILPDTTEGRFTNFMEEIKMYNDLENRTTNKDVKKVFDNFRSGGGLQNESLKMFLAMVEAGNVDEVTELFNSTGEMNIHPLVLVYTCAIEAYTNSCEINGALQTFLDMVAGGLNPNSYTYSVLIKGLAADPKFFGDAKKYLLEMLDKGMKPNADSYTAVLESFGRQEDTAAEKECEEFLEVMKAKGFVPDAEAVWAVLEDKQAPVISWIMSIILSKLEQ